MGRRGVRPSVTSNKKQKDSVMPQVTWLVFDNITRAQEVVDRIGVWCNLCDGSGPGWDWGPVYEDLDAEGGAKYAVEFNNTLMLGPGFTAPKVWNTAATLQNNPKGVVANNGDPLFWPEDMAHLELIEFDNFVEHDYTPPEE
jgi:hypothetical protein